MINHLASCFISYNHADAELARGIAAALEANGYYVWIDEGQLKLGDSLIQSIGDAIDQVDFLVALVSEHSMRSEWCKKELALAMTGELNRRQVSVLVCRVGDAVVPPSLVDKLYLQVSSDDAAGAAAELDRHMRLHLTPSAPIPKRHSNPTESNTKKSRSALLASLVLGGFNPLQPVKMRGVDLNGVTTPRNDGTGGIALYRVPITLEPAPDYQWSELFVHHFNEPRSYTSMHRPGIASVVGDRIILDGTTMEELERYHLATLKLAVAAANADRKHAAELEAVARKRAQEAAEAHRTTNADIASRLRFD
jgi:hypothetical protein